jgi:hypothetical protein
MRQVFNGCMNGGSEFVILAPPFFFFVEQLNGFFHKVFAFFLSCFPPLPEQKKKYSFDYYN